MAKVVWITALNKEKNQLHARTLHQTTSKYGVTVEGHFWQDDLAQMAWAGAREDLVRKETGLWIILGSADDLTVPSVRYGLSLLAIGVQAQKGYGFPIMVILTEGTLEPDSLPTPLAGAEVFALDAAGLGPKITARANTPVKKIDLEYCLDIYGVQGLGQWFEVGPAEGHTWNGVMFGVSNGEINAHGVGPAHKLPERAVLEYPMKGLKLAMGDTEYTAWAVQNKLDPESSYYLRVNEYPEAILFGPMAEGDDAEVYIVRLK
jgi:hypothetical protein